MNSRARIVNIIKDLRYPPILADVAREVGVSRERVRQIIAEERPDLLPYRGQRKRLPTTPAELAQRKIQASSRQGRVLELTAASDLVSRGYLVYWPLTGAGPDLIITDRSRSTTWLVEVRPGRDDGKSVEWKRGDYAAHLWAVVTPQRKVYYYRQPDGPTIEPLG